MPDLTVTPAELEALRVAQLHATAQTLRAYADTLDELRETADKSSFLSDAHSHLRIVREDLDALDALGWEA